MCGRSEVLKIWWGWLACDLPVLQPVPVWTSKRVPHSSCLPFSHRLSRLPFSIQWSCLQFSQQSSCLPFSTQSNWFLFSTQSSSFSFSTQSNCLPSSTPSSCLGFFQRSNWLLLFLPFSYEFFCNIEKSYWDLKGVVKHLFTVQSKQLW